MSKSQNRKSSSGNSTKTKNPGSNNASGIEVAYNATVRPKSRQIVKIQPVTYQGLKTVDIAVTDPRGNSRLVKAKRNNRSYYAYYNTRFLGLHNASVVAYWQKGQVSIRQIDFQVAEPGAVKKKSAPKAAAKSKPQPRASVANIPVPTLPKDFKMDDIKVWPNSSAYAQSLQNIKFSISDNYSDLKSGAIEKNPNVKYTSYIFGSGNFGTVFKLSSSGKAYALKCFTRAPSNLAERYFFISYYLSKLNFPFLVDFQYLPLAVRQITKPKDYYPMLKMGWISGESLNSFLKSHINDQKKIRSVANEFINHVISLQSNGISHGDLSGDNILVDAKGKVRLIDYDGMYVPAFKGRDAPERGHEHFQHPDRDKHYSEYIDNFSALVIYTSLLALSKDPSLWDYNEDDGDKLILSVDDFNDPASSELLKKIASQGGKVKKLASLIAKAKEKGPLWEGISAENIKAAR